MKKALALGGSVLSAALAFLPAACCLGPLSLLLAGLGTASFGLALLPYAPYFSGAALALLGANFYLTYRRGAGAAREAGTRCSKTSGVGRKILLCVAAAAVVAMSILPFAIAYIPVG